MIYSKLHWYKVFIKGEVVYKIQIWCNKKKRWKRLSFKRKGDCYYFDKI